MPSVKVVLAAGSEEQAAELAGAIRTAGSLEYETVSGETVSLDVHSAEAC